jgi:hypothetical protein
MIRSVSHLALIVLVLLTSGCGNFLAAPTMLPTATPTKTPTATSAPPTAAPSPLPPTATPVLPTETSTETAVPPTPTPANALLCRVIKARLQRDTIANVYALLGTNTAAATEIAALQVDISGELGSGTHTGNRTITADYHGNISVSIDEKRTYASSQHTYSIVGTVTYNAPDLEKLARYVVIVSGGPFGSNLQTCEKS